MKKGFTLVELLAVLLILGIILTITTLTITRVTNNAKKETLVLQTEIIESAARSWAAENPFLLPVEEGKEITLFLFDLLDNGYIDEYPINPVTGKTFDPTNYILIYKSKEGHEFTFYEEEYLPLTEIEIINNDLRVQLIGESIVDVILNSDYIDKGVLATTSDGYKVTDLETQIFSNGVEVTSINTSFLGRYRITYTATHGDVNIQISRLVRIVDNIPPIIEFIDNISINIDEVPGYNYLEGVSIFDNSGTYKSLEVSGSLVQIPGVYSIKYTAKDNSNNESIEYRRIKVVE